MLSIHQAARSCRFDRQSTSCARFARIGYRREDYHTEACTANKTRIARRGALGKQRFLSDYKYELFECDIDPLLAINHDWLLSSNIKVSGFIFFYKS